MRPSDSTMVDRRFHAFISISKGGTGSGWMREIITIDTNSNSTFYGVGVWVGILGFPGVMSASALDITSVIGTFLSRLGLNVSIFTPSTVGSAKIWCDVFRSLDHSDVRL